MNEIRFPINVRVSNSGGTYQTQTVAGQRASCTSSAEVAMGRLVDKLHLSLLLMPGTLAIKELPAKGQAPGASVWQVQRNTQSSGHADQA